MRRSRAPLSRDRLRLKGVPSQNAFGRAECLLPAVESRHEQVRKLRDDMLSGIGEERGIDREAAIPAMASNPKAEALIQIKTSGWRRDTLGCEPASASILESPMRAVSVQETGEGWVADPTESSDEQAYLVCDLRSPLARHRGPKPALSVDADV